jgi:hypothetical protein
MTELMGPAMVHGDLIPMVIGPAVIHEGLRWADTIRLGLARPDITHITPNESFYICSNGNLYVKKTKTNSTK